MERKRFEGLKNVVKFNFQKYLLAAFVGIIGLVLLFTTENNILFFLGICCQTTWLLIFNSLLVSFWIYDYSPLYKLEFLNDQVDKSALKILNISSGFDEIGGVLKSKFPKAEIRNMDIFKALPQRELSIQLAKKQNSSGQTEELESLQIPLDSGSMDIIVLFFAAHEIREDSYRQDFFYDLNRVLKSGGTLFITEHQRDLSNFLAYSFGFLHFYSNKLWLDLFRKTRFNISEEITENPWVKTYKLKGA